MPQQQDDHGEIARVTATQQRDAADLLDRARTGRIQSVSHAGVTGSEHAVVWSGPESSTEGIPRGEVAPAVGFEPTT